jgi:hypothetical protein
MLFSPNRPPLEGTIGPIIGWISLSIQGNVPLDSISSSQITGEKKILTTGNNSVTVTKRNNRTNFRFIFIIYYYHGGVSVQHRAFSLLQLIYVDICIMYAYYYLCNTSFFWTILKK